MSHRRKHVTASALDDIDDLKDGQHIVRCLGTRGGNIVEVEHADGKSTLCLMPSKFNKKLWVRKGGYLVIEESLKAAADTKVTGTILTVLYDEQIKQLKRTPGSWPAKFLDKPGMPAQGTDKSEAVSADVCHTTAVGQDVASQQHDSEGSDSEDNLPPLQQNNNRKVIYHDVSNSSDDESV